MCAVVGVWGVCIADSVSVEVSQCQHVNVADSVGVCVLQTVCLSVCVADSVGGVFCSQ